MSLICVNMSAARTMDSCLIIVRGEITAVKLRPHIVHSNKVVNGPKEGFSVGDEKNGRAKLHYSAVSNSVNRKHARVCLSSCVCSD